MNPLADHLRGLRSRPMGRLLFSAAMWSCAVLAPCLAMAAETTKPAVEQSAVGVFVGGLER